MRTLPGFGRCFVCGDQNRCGTAVSWREVAGGVEGIYVAVDHHCGYEGIIHGGVLSALLDECAGWAVALRHGALCFTSELKVRFLAPVRVGREVIVRGRSLGAVAEDGRSFSGAAEITDAAGNVYATCEARFFPLPAAIQRAVLARLHLPGAPPGQALADYLWPAR